MRLSIYPVTLCGEDYQSGKPLEISDEGADLYELKLKANDLVMCAMTKKKCDGKCFVEMIIEKDGQHIDSDEWFVDVDLYKKTVEVVR